MRDRLVAVVALLVLAGTAGAGWAWLSGVEDDGPPDPVDAALAWVDAWEASDVDALAEMLTTPDRGEVEEALQAFEALTPQELDATVTEVTTGAVDGTAQATIQADLALEGSLTWTWTTTIDLERSRGRWRVEWGWSTLHPSLADGVRFERRDVEVPRAPILARDGQPLTAQGNLVVVGIEPRRIVDAERLASSLQGLLPEAVEPLQKTLARDDLVDTWFYPLVTVPDLRLSSIEVQVAALPGIILRDEQGRVAADDDFALHTLGRVGPASAEQAAARGIAEGIEVGRSGLEAAFDADLRGGQVTEIVVVEDDGDEREITAVLGTDTGSALTTTLDADVQLAIERALRGVEDLVAVVAVDVSDGGVLGIASRPTIGYHRALEGAYPPGGAAWPVTLLAAVEAGWDADRPVACPDSVRVGGVRFSNPDQLGRGTLPLADAVAAGCRASIALLAEDITDASLLDWAMTLGFGHEPALPLTTGSASWPPPADLADRAAEAVGQGRVLATPLHLAAAGAAIAGGTWHPPALLLDDVDVDAGVVLRQATAAEVRAILQRSGEAAGMVGVGLVSGESRGPDGELAWALLTREDLALVVLVERGRAGDAVRLASRTNAEIDALRS